MNNDFLEWQVWVAVYAAIVATGVLFLEVRRWIESGPRLYLTASTNMLFIGGGAYDKSVENSRYVSVLVLNRGSLPTTITNLCLLQYDNWWRRFRYKSSRSAVVNNPSLGWTGSGQIPYMLEPGGQWTGFIPQNAELNEWIDAGHLYAAIFTTHQDRPMTTRLRMRPKPPGDTNGKTKN